MWGRDPDDAKQQYKVRGHEGIVGAAHVAEQPMVVDPHDADENEAEQKAAVGRPLGSESLPEGCRGGWGLEFEHQQRGCDGEDAVGEGFNAAGFAGHGVFRGCSCRVSGWRDDSRGVAIAFAVSRCCEGFFCLGEEHSMTFVTTKSLGRIV